MPFGKREALTTERRSDERHPVAVPATIRLTGGEPEPIVIEDLSRTGFSGVIPFAVQIGSLLRVGLPNGHMPHARVIWMQDGRSGCEFMTPMAEDEIHLLNRA